MAPVKSVDPKDLLVGGVLQVMSVPTSFEKNCFCDFCNDASVVRL